MRSFVPCIELVHDRGGQPPASFILAMNEFTFFDRIFPRIDKGQPLFFIESELCYRARPWQ